MNRTSIKTRAYETSTYYAHQESTMCQYIPSIHDPIWYQALRLAGEALAARPQDPFTGDENARPVAGGETHQQPRRRKTRRTRSLARAMADLKTFTTPAAGGVYDPADITDALAAAMLTIARAYVRRWSAATADRRALDEAEQEEVVASVLHHIWTRNYAAEQEPVARGHHSRALWGALRLYRRTNWVGPDKIRARIARAAKRTAAEEAAAVYRPRGMQGASADNPAAIVAAAEQASRTDTTRSGRRLGGVYYTTPQRRGAQRKPRRELGRTREGWTTREDALAALCPADDAPRYAGHAAAPEPVAYPIGAACPLLYGRRDLETLAG